MEATLMICQFCKQNVDDPCHNAQEVKHRAMWNVPRCKSAMKHNQGMGSRAHTGEAQGGGKR